MWNPPFPQLDPETGLLLPRWQPLFGSASTLLSMGLCFSELRQLRLAVETLETVLNLKSRNDFAAAKAPKPDYDLAEEDLQLVYYQLARCYSDLGQPDKAIGHLQQAETPWQKPLGRNPLAETPWQ